MVGKRFYYCKQILWIMNHKNNKLARVRALLWLKFNKNNLNVYINTFSCMDIRRQHFIFIPGDIFGHFLHFIRTLVHLHFYLDAMTSNLLRQATSNLLLPSKICLLDKADPRLIFRRWKVKIETHNFSDKNWDEFCLPPDPN